LLYIYVRWWTKDKSRGRRQVFINFNYYKWIPNWMQWGCYPPQSKYITIHIMIITIPIIITSCQCRIKPNNSSKNINFFLTLNNNLSPFHKKLMFSTIIQTNNMLTKIIIKTTISSLLKMVLLGTWWNIEPFLIKYFYYYFIFWIKLYYYIVISHHYRSRDFMTHTYLKIMYFLKH